MELAVRKLARAEGVQVELVAGDSEENLESHQNS
jgi:hypothetical protein